MRKQVRSRTRPSPIGRERGSGAVEFALIMPLFLTLVFGVIEFGSLLTNKISLSNASRVGARYGSLDAANTTSSQTKAETAASGITGCSTPVATSTYSGGSPNQVTTVISCTYSPITPLGHLLSGLVLPSTVSASTTMVVE